MDIYDQIFSTEKNYNGAYGYKLKMVLEWVKRNGFKEILDVGCGRGHYLKMLTENNIKATGLEPSEYIVSTLGGYDVINDDILGEVKSGRKWEGLICMDVLEHIEPEKIDLNLKALSLMSRHAILGIANHSDVWHGVELHLIQQGPSWWDEVLTKHFKILNCRIISKRYFVFEVESL